MAVTGSQSSASPATLIALVVVLAGLDLVGALLAKEWTSGRSPWMFAGGALVFLLLFSVYAIGLRFAEMSTVTFGWIVGLQVAVLFLERVRYGVSLPTGKWIAIVAILGLQAYLVLAPNDGAPAAEPPIEEVVRVQVATSA